ncbi:MAG: hypothetical protein LIP05_00500 [Tannerellaceae bacterium]|nr:hypothetical protein [Tannerellaceae bacterium]
MRSYTHVKIHPSYLFITDFLSTLPDRFVTEGKVIYEGRNILKLYTVDGLELVVKRFKVPFWINRIAYSFVRKSKACRSYEYSLKILEKGLRTAQPIGYIEKYAGGLLSESYYISMYEKDMETVREYVAENSPQYQLFRKAFAEYTAKMHEMEIMHIDYSPGNILVKEQNKDFIFSLVDVNRMKFQRVSFQTAYKNFARLSTSREALNEISSHYARFRKFDVKKFVICTTQYSDNYFRQYAFRLAYKQWKRENHSWFTQPRFRYLYYCQMSSFFWLTREARAHFTQKYYALYNRYIKMYDFRQVLHPESKD